MSTINKKPNIFSYATSELAQDGFLCWLLEWSKESNKSYNSELNQCAVHFVKELLDIPIKTNFTVNKIRILRQRFKIDVLAEINDKYVILIEDKVNTSFSRGQLSKYAKKAEKHYKRPHWNIKKHYLKSYLVWDDERDFVISEGYEVFDIFAFAKFFGSYKAVKNDFFEDFLLNISERRDRYLSYKTIPPKSWHPNTWNNFLYELRKALIKMTTIHGKFGSYHSGNNYWFLLTWLSDYKEVGSHVSLEFNSGSLVVKSHIKDSGINKRKQRLELIKRLLTIYAGTTSAKFKVVGGQGKRLNDSKSMAILEFSDYFKLDKSGRIDFDKTCLVIKELNTTFKSL